MRGFLACSLLLASSAAQPPQQDPAVCAPGAKVLEDIESLLQSGSILARQTEAGTGGDPTVQTQQDRSGVSGGGFTGRSAAGALMAFADSFLGARGGVLPGAYTRQVIKCRLGVLDAMSTLAGSVVGVIVNSEAIGEKNVCNSTYVNHEKNTKNLTTLGGDWPCIRHAAGIWKHVGFFVSSAATAYATCAERTLKEAAAFAGNADYLQKTAGQGEENGEPLTEAQREDYERKAEEFRQKYQKRLATANAAKTGVKVGYCSAAYNSFFNSIPFITESSLIYHDTCTTGLGKNLTNETLSFAPSCNLAVSLLSASGLEMIVGFKSLWDNWMKPGAGCQKKSDSDPHSEFEEDDNIARWEKVNCRNLPFETLTTAVKFIYNALEVSQVCGNRTEYDTNTVCAIGGMRLSNSVITTLTSMYHLHQGTCGAAADYALQSLPDAEVDIDTNKYVDSWEGFKNFWQPGRKEQMEKEEIEEGVLRTAHNDDDDANGDGGDDDDGDDDALEAAEKALGIDTHGSSETGLNERKRLEW